MWRTSQPGALEDSLKPFLRFGILLMLDSDGINRCVQVTSVIQSFLKQPDVMAPGVSIIAASIPSSDSGDGPVGKKPSNFAIRSGTSMACPHVAGAGAFVKSAHPRWSPSMIRSALMTTGKLFHARNSFFHTKIDKHLIGNGIKSDLQSPPGTINRSAATIANNKQVAAA